MKPPFQQAVRRGLRFRCPNCGQGRVFSSFFRMRDECPVCRLSFYPESGYYAGAMYLDYLLTAGIFLLIWVPTLFLPEVVHLSYWTKDILWVGFGALLCLGLARPSYSLWLAIDYWITPWKADADEERQKKEEKPEIPLVSLTIRSESDDPPHGKGDKSED